MQSKLVGQQARLSVSVLLDNQARFHEAHKLDPWDGKRSKSSRELLIRAEVKGTGGLSPAKHLPSELRNDLVSAWYGGGTARISVTGALRRSVASGFSNYSANTRLANLFLADPALCHRNTRTRVSSRRKNHVRNRCEPAHFRQEGAGGPSQARSETGGRGEAGWSWHASRVSLLRARASRLVPGAR